MKKDVQKVNIRNVAEACGFSIYTVSSVLNQKGDISQDTTQKVLDAVQTLGYQPKVKRSRSPIAIKKSAVLVLPKMYSGRDEFYFRAIESAMGVTNELHVDCQLITEERLCEQLQETPQGEESPELHAAVLFCCSHNHKLERLLSQHSIPTGLVRRQSQMKGSATFCDNDVGGIQMILEHLFELGHRRIAITGYGVEPESKQGRVIGYREFLTQRQLPQSDDWIFPFKGKTQLGNSWDLFKRDQITALVCNTDSIAVCWIKALMSEGWNVPKDISVTGYNDDPIAAQFFPEITSVEVPVQEMVEAAFRTLMLQPVGKSRLATSVSFANTLKVRGSTSRVYGQ